MHNESTSSSVSDYSEADTSFGQQCDLGDERDNTLLISREELEKKINSFRNTCILQVLIMHRTKEKKEHIEKRVEELEQEWLNICEYIQVQPEFVPFNIDEMDQWTSAWYKVINKMRRQIADYYDSKTIQGLIISEDKLEDLDDSTSDYESHSDTDSEYGLSHSSSSEQRDSLDKVDRSYKINNDARSPPQIPDYRVSNNSKEIILGKPERERIDFNCSPIGEGSGELSINRSDNLTRSPQESESKKYVLQNAQPLSSSNQFSNSELINLLQQSKTNVETLRERCLQMSNLLTKSRSERDHYLIQLDLIKLQKRSENENQYLLDSIYLFDQIREKYMRELDQLNQLQQQCEEDIRNYSNEVINDQSQKKSHFQTGYSTVSNEEPLFNINKQESNTSISPSRKQYMTPVNTRRTLSSTVLTPSQIEERRDNEELLNTFERLSHSISVHNTPKVAKNYYSPNQAVDHSRETGSRGIIRLQNSYSLTTSLFPTQEDHTRSVATNLVHNSSETLARPPSSHSLSYSSSTQPTDTQRVHSQQNVYQIQTKRKRELNNNTAQVIRRTENASSTDKGRQLNKDIMESKEKQSSSTKQGGTPNDVLIQAKKRLIETCKQKKAEEELQKQKEADRVKKLELLKEKQRKKLEKGRKQMKSRENLEQMLSEEFPQDEEEDMNKTETDLVQRLRIDESRRKAQIRARESKKKEEERKLKEKEEEILKKNERFKKRNERLHKFKERKDKELSEEKGSKKLQSGPTRKSSPINSAGFQEMVSKKEESNNVKTVEGALQPKYLKRDDLSSQPTRDQRTPPKPNTTESIEQYPPVTSDIKQSYIANPAQYDYNYYLSEYPGSNLDEEQLASLHKNHQSDYSHLMIGEHAVSDYYTNEEHLHNQEQLQLSPYPSQFAPQSGFDTEDNHSSPAKLIHKAFPLSMQQANLYPYHEELIDRELEHIAQANDASGLEGNFEDTLYNPPSTSTSEYDSSKLKGSTSQQLANRFGFRRR